MKNRDKIDGIGLVFLAIAFMMISWSSYVYIKDNTNFFEQSHSLIENKFQWVKLDITFFWGSGIIIFGIAIFLLKYIKQVFLLFLLESLSLLVSVLLILFLFISNYTLFFKAELIVSSFAIYYALYRIRRRIESDIK